MKRVLCIRLPNWPLARLKVARPELEDKPLVLCAARRGVVRVAARSSRAGALGIAVGMPLAEATSLVGGCTLQQYPYDPLADRAALEELAAWSGRFSPTVGLEDSAAPDSLLLDVTGLEPIFGSEASLAEKIIRDFNRRRLAVRLGVADTLGAAWAVTHFDGRGKGEGGRGKAACGLAVLAPGETSTALRPLPIEALRLSAEVVGLLHQLGVYRIGQLEALPREDLSSRFGPGLLERMDQAAGRLAEPIPARPRAPRLQAQQSLEYPTTRRETIEFVLERLIGRVAEMLASCGRGVLQLECRLDCQSTGSVELSVGLFKATASAGHLLGLARMQLERSSLPAPVAAVLVRAVATAPLEYRQEEMFPDDSARRNPRHLSGLVDRLSSRLGRRAVLRARLLSDAQPELAYCYDPLVRGRKRRRRSGRGRVFGLDLPPRPLRLLQRPTRLAAVSVMPDGPPLGFHLRGRRQQIARTWGPERIETGWWRGRPVGRDYWRIETATGRRYWLFRRLRDGEWFLHGIFE